MEKQGKNAPNHPGVYFFKNKRKIIYIGKAQNLKNRISGYFLASRLEKPKKEMLKEATGYSWKETDSEVEALVLESELIKKIRPKYNILMRDDKQYFYAGFTKKKFPKIFITHQKTNSDKKIKASYIGPFTDGWSLRYVLSSLRKAFPYCTCAQYHKKPCARAEMGLCLGVCCQTSPDIKKTKDLEKVYKKNIQTIRNILSGEQPRIIKSLKKEMAGLSKNMMYESAARVRNQISALENIFEHRHTIKRDRDAYAEKGLGYLKNLFKMSSKPGRIEAYDISNIQGTLPTGAMVVFKDGHLDKDNYRKFKIRLPEKPNDTAMMGEVLSRRFGHPEWPFPDIIIIDGGKGQLNSAIAVLNKLDPKYSKTIKVAALAKKEEELYLPTGEIIKLKENPPPLLHLLENIRDEAHRFAISYHRKRRSAQF